MKDSDARLAKGSRNRRSLWRNQHGYDIGRLSGKLMPMRRTSLLYRLIFGPNAALYSYEIEILRAVKERLSQESSRRLNAQLENLPLRQRQDNARILAFFPKKNHDIPPEFLFGNRGDDVCFATIELQRQAAKETTLIARLWATGGSFFSIEYDITPSRKGFEDGTEVIVTNVTINADLESAPRE